LYIYWFTSHKRNNTFNSDDNRFYKPLHPVTTTDGTRYGIFTRLLLLGDEHEGTTALPKFGHNVTFKNTWIYCNITT